MDDPCDGGDHGALEAHEGVEHQDGAPGQAAEALGGEGVEEAFGRILEINRRYEKIEMTANFLFGDTLPEGHLPSFFDLLERRTDPPLSKGAIYFSPLLNGRTRERRGIKREFYRIKLRSRLPTFLYLIQRL